MNTFLPCSFIEKMQFLEQICRDGVPWTKFGSRHDPTLEGRRKYLDELDMMISQIETSLAEAQRIVAVTEHISASILAERGEVLQAANKLVIQEKRFPDLPIEVLQLISTFTYPPLDLETFYQLKPDYWGHISLPSARLCFYSTNFFDKHSERRLLENSAPMKLVIELTNYFVAQSFDLALEYSERWSSLEFSTLTNSHSVCKRLESEGRLSFSNLTSLTIPSSHLACKSTIHLLVNVVELRVHFDEPHDIPPDWIPVLGGSLRLKTISLTFFTDYGIPPCQQSTQDLLVLPLLRNFSLMVGRDYLSLSKLIFLINRFNVDCGWIEEVSFLERGGKTEQHIECGQKELIEALNHRFPRLRTLLLDSPSINKATKGHSNILTMVLAHRAESFSGGPPWFPNMTELSIVFEYSHESFFSVHEFILYRRSNPQTKALQSLTLIGEISSDDPFGFVRIFQMYVPNVTVMDKV